MRLGLGHHGIKFQVLWIENVLQNVLHWECSGKFIGLYNISHQYCQRTCISVFFQYSVFAGSGHCYPENVVGIWKIYSSLNLQYMNIHQFWMFISICLWTFWIVFGTSSFLLAQNCLKLVSSAYSCTLLWYVIHNYYLMISIYALMHFTVLTV